MSRPLRIQYPNAWYHIMNRARRGQNLFAAVADKLIFIDTVKETAAMFNFKVSAFCLMPTHYHLLAQTPDANLARCMRHIDGVYTQRYNVRNHRDGSLFKGRYKSILVDADSYLLELVRYIHRNPLRAGLVRRMDRYPWSSHHGYLADAKEWKWLHKDFVLGMLAKNKRDQVNGYRQFVEKQDSEQLVPLLEKNNLPSLLGGKPFVDWVKKTFSKDKIDKEVPKSKILNPDRDSIIKTVCGFYAVEQTALTAVRRGVQNEPRDAAIYLLRTVCGDPLMQIGNAFGMTQYSSVSSAVDRVKKKMKNDSAFAERLITIEELIKKGQT